MNIRYSSLIALATITGALFIYTACSSDDAVTESNPDAGGASSSGQAASSGGPVQPLPDAGTQPDGAPADCYTLTDASVPTNFEIINACTDADRIVRNPTLAKIYPDGGLPPLQ